MPTASDGPVGTCTIGGVTLEISEAPDSPLIPAVPPVRGMTFGSDSQAKLAALRWMMQKVKMKQDMFLLGAPGPLLRHLVLRFCELFRREVEYVGITRDTSEADLKQRCEIREGSVVYVDQAPVRAALHGRVLILEGIEKAERNVLPLLNNLLENREMALEDRRFLLAPVRAAQLRSEGGTLVDRLVPVHPDFIVVALGLPGRGNPLDPPLRSRFAAFSVSPTPPSEELEALLHTAPSVPLSTVQRLSTAAGALQQLAAGAGGARGLAEPLKLPTFPEGGLGGVVRLLESLPEMDLASAVERVYPVHLMPSLTQRQREVIATALAGLRGGASAEYSLLAVRQEEGEIPAAVLTFVGGKGPGGAEQAELRAPAGRWMLAGSAGGGSAGASSTAGVQEEDEAAKLGRLTVRELKAWLTARGLQHSDCFEKQDLLRRAREGLSKGARGPPPPRGVLAQPVGGVQLSASQAAALSAVLADHVADVDVCLVGEKGVGKSTIVRAFAALLGYRARAVFCYKDMTSRDLLQRRTTDAAGNTHWQDSPLVEAAVRGELVVLDGVQRLAPGMLYSALGPLLLDREASLPDGSRLVPAARWAALERRHGAASLAARGVRPVHPAFRCIACGEPPGSGGASGEAWLDDEVATLFHFHALQPLPAVEQRSLLGQSGESRTELERLFRYSEDIRKAADRDANLSPLRLSLRVLLRVAAHLRSRPGDLAGALERAFAACLRFLPPASREAAGRLLREAAGGEAFRAEAAAAGQPKQREALRQRAAAAAGKQSLGSTTVGDGVVSIGAVSCPQRSPQRPELVPDVAFVDIPKHVAALQDMLLDWSLGHHLLLIGNQGVGKNKLADRLLCLLRCEREYVQLHRDTTVQSLTLAPSLEAGKVVWEDSPLVRAVKAGRCLVVDEADKAPLEVVCVLKALVEDGELALMDGRTIVRPGDVRLRAAAAASADDDGAGFIEMAEGFRMIVLANRPGFPFLGNDFFRVCGDVFSCHTIDNPDIESEVTLLRSVGPDVPHEQIVQLSLLFSELRDLVDKGKLAYPYSTRELVKLVEHAQEFPDDTLEQIAADVFAFDVVDGKRRGGLLEVLKVHGVATTSRGEATLLGTNRGDRGYSLKECGD